MKLEGENGVLEIQRCDVGAPGTPADQDVLLSITVEVTGYSASDTAWIISQAFESFLTQLQTLDFKRQGRAVLEGASPSELRLEFFSTDSAGHMAVQGHIGRQTSERHSQQLRFGFDFESDRLPSFFSGLRSLVSRF
jgi:hypothetical protein